MKINLFKTPKIKNDTIKSKWKIVSLWDSKEEIYFDVKENESPEKTAIWELGYKIVKNNC